MARHQPDQIRFSKPPPRFVNRLGYALVVSSGLYALVTHFLEVEHFAIQWGPYLAIPVGFLGLCLALQRRSQILELEQKKLVQIRSVLGLPISRKAQSLQAFSQVRLSEDQVEVNGETIPLYRLFLEGKVTPALLTSYHDKNEATQRLKSIAKLVDLPISWPQV